jgi:RimJ/RimL family protein N-acetyltransferase
MLKSDPRQRKCSQMNPDKVASLTTDWPEQYKAWPFAKRIDEDLLVRSVHIRDAEMIRVWRNSQLAVLRQKSCVSWASQQSYFMSDVRSDFDSQYPDKILLAVERDGNMIAYGGLVHFDWKARKAEVSFLAETEIAGTSADYLDAFPRFLSILKTIAFDDLGLNRIWAETYDTRIGYVAALQNAGFHQEGRLREAVNVQGDLVGSVLQGLLASDL